VIGIFLRDLRWRFALVALLGLVFYAWELQIQSHAEEDALLLGPLGISATPAYFASVAMIVLLAGFISRDRRFGYSRLYFSHPTSPLAFYGAQWALAYVCALGSAAVLFVALQITLWGSIQGGWTALLLPGLTALIFGGVMAFFSALLPTGDVWVALAFFFPTFLPEVFNYVLGFFPSLLRQLLLFVVPPQTTALQQVYEQILAGHVAWGASAFSAGYALVLLAGAVLMLRLREWP
jgi:hypothetical protein